MTDRATEILGAFGMQRPEWMERGLCRGFAELHGAKVRDDLFFPTRGAATKPGKAMCADCPVAQECLDYALVAGIKYGIWGGLSERERRPLRKARNAERRAVAS